MWQGSKCTAREKCLISMRYLTDAGGEVMKGTLGLMIKPQNTGIHTLKGAKAFLYQGSPKLRKLSCPDCLQVMVPG